MTGSGREAGSGPVAARLARLRGSSGVATGLVSVPAAAALAGVGFVSVSEVFGAVASSVRTGDFLQTGVGPSVRWSVSSYGQRTLTSSTPRVVASPPRTVTALREGYRTVLARLLGEARAVGADGVVGVRIERDTAFGGGQRVWTFRAAGTAVRSVGPTRAGTPFVTTLPAAQVAAAVRGGWLPLSIVVCPVMAIRYSGAQTRQTVQRWGVKRWGVNAEVEAFTDIVNTTRHQAREDFAAAARAVGADGAVLTDMTLAFEQSGTDPVCQATVVLTGTTLARLPIGPTTAARAPLTVVPLDRGL